MEDKYFGGKLLEGNIMWIIILAVTFAVFHVEMISKMGKPFGGKNFWREKPSEGNILEGKTFGGKTFGGFILEEILEKSPLQSLSKQGIQNEDG